MKRILLLATGVALLWNQAARKAPDPAAESFDYDPLERVLQAYVDSKGLVNYRGLKQDRKDLDGMVRRMTGTSPANAPQLFPTREARLAYWINAYNAWVLRIVLDRYPISSITRIGVIPYGAFFIVRVELGGRKFTLRHLENDIIRAGFHDPRIHFAINCASLSCPPLMRHAYRVEMLDQQLDAAARQFINNDRNVTLDVAGNRIVLSKIFDWYASDFEEGYAERFHKRGTVIDYLKLYLTPERQHILGRLSTAKISYHEYDWGLNEQPTTR